MNLTLREMQAADIGAGLQLCRASHWNQLRRDWEMFLHLSPRDCRVALIEKQIVGTVAAVNYENRFGWIAMVLVDPTVRGQGIAKALMNEALLVLKDVPAIRLDATPAGQHVYRKLGFVDEYSLSRMEAVIEAEKLPVLNQQTRPMQPEDLPAVFRLDHQTFGADRRVLLEWMLAGAPDYAWVYETSRQITGYCFGRHGYNAEHLGPVIAHDETTARALVTACLHSQNSQRFYLDATHHLDSWRVWLEAIGFREQRPFMRMMRGNNLWLGLPEKQFAIVGPEFG